MQFLVMASLSLTIFAGANLGATTLDARQCARLMSEHVQAQERHMFDLQLLPVVLEGKSSARIMVQIFPKHDEFPYVALDNLGLSPAPNVQIPPQFTLLRRNGVFAVIAGESNQVIGLAMELGETYGAKNVSVQVLDVRGPNRKAPWEAGTKTLQMAGMDSALILEELEKSDDQRATIYDVDLFTGYFTLPLEALADISDEEITSLGIEFVDTFNRVEFKKRALAMHMGSMTVFSQHAFQRLKHVKEVLARPATNLSLALSAALDHCVGPMCTAPSEIPALLAAPVVTIEPEVIAPAAIAAAAVAPVLNELTGTPPVATEEAHAEAAHEEIANPETAASTEANVVTEAGATGEALAHSEPEASQADAQLVEVSKAFEVPANEKWIEELGADAEARDILEAAKAWHDRLEAEGLVKPEDKLKAISSKKFATAIFTQLWARILPEYEMPKLPEFNDSTAMNAHFGGSKRAAAQIQEAWARFFVNWQDHNEEAMDQATQGAAKIQAEHARAEEERVAQERAAEEARAAEAAQAAEAKRAAEAARVEEERLAQERAAEEARAAEAARIAEAARAAEAARVAEAARLAEEARAEAARLAEEQRAAEARAEEARRAEEQRAAEARAEQERVAEAERLAAEAAKTAKANEGEVLERKPTETALSGAALAAEFESRLAKPAAVGSVADLEDATVSIAVQSRIIDFIQTALRMKTPLKTDDFQDSMVRLFEEIASEVPYKKYERAVYNVNEISWDHVRGQYLVDAAARDSHMQDDLLHAWTMFNLVLELPPPGPKTLTAEQVDETIRHFGYLRVAVEERVISTPSQKLKLTVPREAREDAIRSLRDMSDARIDEMLKNWHGYKFSGSEAIRGNTWTILFSPHGHAKTTADDQAYLASIADNQITRIDESEYAVKRFFTLVGTMLRLPDIEVPVPFPVQSTRNVIVEFQAWKQVQFQFLRNLTPSDVIGILRRAEPFNAGGKKNNVVQVKDPMTNQVWGLTLEEKARGRYSLKNIYRR